MKSDLTTALAAPNKVTLAQQAARLQHPRIPPIILDFSKSLIANELAVIAVLVNPDIKALRAKNGVAQAQVFEAGYCPIRNLGPLLIVHCIRLQI